MMGAAPTFRREGNPGLAVGGAAIPNAAMASPPLPDRAVAPPPASRRVELARALLVVAASVVVWLWHQERWTPSSWQTPTAYHGDAYEILARLKAASEGDTWPMTSQKIERLGAPFGAYWNAYPTPDKPLMLALGGLARVIGLFPAANAGLLLAQALAALAFYWVVRRWLRVRWEWAAAGALLFAYTYATYHRGLAHFSFVFTWTVPPGLLTVWLVARRRRLEWRSPGGAVCLGAAAALGAHNPYNLYFWLQLMAWALLAQWFGARRRANLILGGAAMALALAVFAAMHWEHWFFRDEPDGLPLLARNYGGTERYALKPVEMFIPPATHRLEPLAFFGQRYNRWSEWRGEEIMPYLGLAGVAGLVWLLVAGIRRLLVRRPLPGPAPPLLWLLAFASVGGVTNIVSFFTGLQLFRATNRVVVFVAALVLVFLVTRLSRLTAAWPAGARLAAALALAALGLLDQIPPSAPPEERAAIAAAVESDRRLARELERTLPARAMVFQLPVMGFPEVTPPWRLSDYEHFRPYLHTDSFRFSYGAAKFRARSHWQVDLENADPAMLARTLEEYGFAALYLDRKGYEDRADAILAELDRLGYRQRIEDAQSQQIVVKLRPATDPKPPLARQMTIGRGWHPQGRDGLRWAYADASLTYHNPWREPRAFNVGLWLSADLPQTVEFRHEGRRVASYKIGPEARMCRLPRHRLEPGVNRFELRSDRPPRRWHSRRYGLRSFALHQVTVSPAEDDEPLPAATPQ